MDPEGDTQVVVVVDEEEEEEESFSKTKETKFTNKIQLILHEDAFP